jgi:hypothetical protein
MLEYYTRRQKQFGAMEPNMKMLIKELMKEVHDEIQSLRKEMKDGFTEIAVHEVTVNTRISKLATVVE